MVKPKRGDGTRPAELIALSTAFAVFAGLVVLMSTRDALLALIFFGIAFIVSLVGLAMLSLAGAPNELEQRDLDDQDRYREH